MRCTSTYGACLCELAEGHDGDHLSHKFGSRRVWTDEQVTQLHAEHRSQEEMYEGPRLPKRPLIPGTLAIFHSPPIPPAPIAITREFLIPGARVSVRAEECPTGVLATLTPTSPISGRDDDPRAGSPRALRELAKKLRDWSLEVQVIALEEEVARC